MAQTVEQLLIRIDATTEVLRRELKAADTSVKKFDTSVGKSLKSIDGRFRTFQKQISGVMTGAFSIYGAKRFFDYVSESSTTLINLRAQLKLVSNSQAEVDGSFNSLLDIANRTGQAFDSTATTFSRLARNTADLGLNQGELLRMTESLNKAFVVSGTTGREASNAMIQLSQAFGKGRLDGEELNAVMEQAPILAREIAKSAGVAYGGLKGAAEEGKLTVDILIDAMRNLGWVVDRQFVQMPVTIERAMMELKNNMLVAFGDVDAGPLVESIEDLSELITNPAVIDGLQNIAAGVVKIGEVALTAAAGIGALGKAIGEELAVLVGGPAVDDTKRLNEELANMQSYLRALEREGGSAAEIEGVTKQIAELAKKIAVATEFEEMNLAVTLRTSRVLMAKLEATAANTKATDASNESTGENIELTEEQVKSYKKFYKALAPVLKMQEEADKIVADIIEKNKEQIAAADEYIETLEFELSLIGKTAREQAVLTAQREYDAKATADQVREIGQLSGAIYDQEAALKQSEEAMAQAQAQWDKGRDVLSDFFFEFALEGKNAFETLTQGFKAMIAKMVAEWAANKALLALGGIGGGGLVAGLMGGGSAGTMPAGGGGLSGLFGPGSGISEQVLTGLEGFFAKHGMTGTAGMLYNAQVGLGKTGALFGGGIGLGSAITSGAGIAGGLLGSQLYGQTSGIGSGLGGAAGGIFGASLGALGAAGGPLGAALGALGGGFVESLFGGKNNGDNRGRGTLNLATGQADVYGVGKSFNQENVDALNEIIPILQQIAEGIGGSNAILEVAMGNRSGLSLNGQKFGRDEAGFIAAAIEAMVDGAQGLSKTLKTLIKGFEGTSDEMVAFATSLVSIDKLITDNPIDRAFKDYADAQRTAGSALTQVYNEQVKIIKDLTYSYDGSARAAVALNTALSENKQYAYDMAMAIKAIGESTSQQVQGQLQYFFDQTRTDDEKLVAFQAQFERLWERLPQLTDPGDIQRVSDRLLWLNKTIFDMGPADLQRSNVGTYAGAARTVEEMTADALDRAGVVLQESQRNLNTEISAMLEVTAQGFQASSDTMYSAAELMYLAVTNFINNNGGYSDSEVVA